jgi:hypothetical protein
VAQHVARFVSNEIWRLENLAIGGVFFADGLQLLGRVIAEQSIDLIARRAAVALPQTLCLTRV